MIYDLGSKKPIVWRLEGVKMCRVATLQLGIGEHQRASTHQQCIMALSPWRYTINFYPDP